jgi:hypothetical protein
MQHFATDPATIRFATPIPASADIPNKLFPTPTMSRPRKMSHFVPNNQFGGTFTRPRRKFFWSIPTPSSSNRQAKLFRLRLIFLSG